MPPLDFLIIGAQKCGTTWLADMLRRHPQVFIPPEKEMFYFNRQFFESPELPNYNHSKPISWYLAFFQNAAPGQLKGEASPAYLWDPAAPRKIFDFDPSLKLIAVLRDPVERAFSQYLYYIQRGVLGDVSFEQALDMRPDLLSRGLYHQQLQRYYALFPAPQIYVAFYDDLQADAAGFLIGVERFLGVGEHVPEGVEERANVTGRPRFPIINRTLARLRYPLRKYNPPLIMDFLRRSGLAALQERVRLLNTRPLEERPQIAPQTAARLRAYFRDDVRALERLTGRDLGKWVVG